jgi:hypothetical protein
VESIGESEALLQAALRYVEEGWYVFPCRPGEKAPATRSGFKAASDDPGQIRKWWAQAPYNIGIWTGASNLVVLDLDFERDATLERVDEWSDDWYTVYDDHVKKAGVVSLVSYLCDHNLSWPATYTVGTPRGGLHLYYEYEGEDITPSAGRFGKDIDVRAGGSYVVAPPSITEVGAYTRDLIEPRLPMPLPDWVRARCLETQAEVASAKPVDGDGTLVSRLQSRRT